MTETSLRQYRGFRTDRRMSMDIYAESMGAIATSEGFDLKVVRPESNLEKYSSSRLVMRYLRYWYYPHLAKREDADLHHVLDHGYAHLIPCLKYLNKNAKTCVTVHDLIPKLTWNGSIKSADGLSIPSRKPWLNLKSLSYLNHYDHIIAVSNNTKNDLIEHLALPADKIEVIGPVIDKIFQPATNQSISDFANKYGFDRDCKWLMITGSEYYKNHQICLKVLAELNLQHEFEFRLVKTGLVSDDFHKMAEDLGLEPKVKSIFIEDTRELAQLYGLVDCLLFPSLYEGFGMPVIEALACGTPVVCSDRGSLPEVSGSLAGICDAGDVFGLSREVTSMVFDNQRRIAVAEQAPEWVHQFRSDVLEPKINRFYHAIADS